MQFLIKLQLYNICTVGDIPYPIPTSAALLSSLWQPGQADNFTIQHTSICFKFSVHFWLDINVWNSFFWHFLMISSGPQERLCTVYRLVGKSSFKTDIINVSAIYIDDCIKVHSKNSLLLDVYLSIVSIHSIFASPYLLPEKRLLWM